MNVEERGNVTRLNFRRKRRQKDLRQIRSGILEVRSVAFSSLKTVARLRSGVHRSPGSIALLWITIVSFLLSASVSAPGAYCETNRISNGATAVRLPNGLRVLLIEEHAFPTISCQTWYHAGSMNDPPGASGTCHVVEHLLTECAKGSAGSLARQLVSNGGKFDAFTSDDFTVFVENLPASKLDLALLIQAERLKTREFTKTEMDLAVRQVLQELDSGAKNYDRLLMKEVRSLVYTRHPYKNLPAGLTDDVKALTPALVNDFIRENFNPQNATVVLAGDISPAETLTHIQNLLGSGIAAKRRFGQLTSAPHLVPSEPDQIGERRVYLKYGGKRHKLVVAFRAPGANEPNTAAAIVLESLLGSTTGGLLKEQIIDTKIGDAVSSAFELKKQPGQLVLSVEAPSAANTSKMLSAVEDLCDKIKEGGFDESDLNEARKRAAFHFLKQKIGPYKNAFQLGLFDSLGKLDQAQDWQKQLEAVSKQDITRLAASYLVPNRRSVGFLLSTANTASSQKTAQNSMPAHTAPNVVAPRVSSGLSCGRQLAMPPETTEITRSQFGNMQIAAYSDRGTLKSYEAVDDDSGSSSGAGGTSKLAADSTSTASDTTSDKGLSKTASIGATLGTGTSSSTSTGTSSSPSASTRSSSTTPATTVSTLATTVSAPTAPNSLSSSTRNISGPSRVGQFTLNNGIRVYVLSVESSPVIRVSGAVRAGQVYDPDNKPGLSDVVVALMNGGSAKITKENSVRMQNQIGLDKSDQIRFFEGREQIRFTTSCLGQDLGTQLKLIRNHLTDPLIDETNLSNARNAVANSIKRRQNTPEDRANRILLQNLLSNASKFNPPDPHDSWASVLKITAEDVNAFKANNIAPSTTSIVLSGNIDQDVAQRLVASAFRDWSGKAKAPAIGTQPNKRQVTKVTLPLEDATKLDIALGRLLPVPVNKNNYVRLLLVDCALTKHPLYARLINSSRMKVEITDAMNMHSTLLPLSQQCAWILNFQVTEAELRGIAGSVKQQLREIGTAGLSAQELNEMKRFVAGQICVTRLCDTAGSADSVIDALSMDREADYWFRQPSRVEQTTLGDMNQFIKDDFQVERACLVATGNKKAIKLVPSFKRGN